MPLPNPPLEPADSQCPAEHDDRRLYLPYPDDWEARIKRGWEKEYCYFQNPGEDFFHLLVGGEVYLQRGSEKYCLNCALRHGIVTHDRLHWQRKMKRPPSRRSDL